MLAAPASIEVSALGTCDPAGAIAGLTGRTARPFLSQNSQLFMFYFPDIFLSSLGQGGGDRMPEVFVLR